MRNRSRIASSLLAALALACSTTPALTVTATPTSIAGDGVTPVTVTANVTSGGAPAPDGTSVHFTADDGAFTGAAASTPGVLDVAAQTGIATATLIPPRKGRGNITIGASSSFTGANVKQFVTVKLTPAGGLASSLQFTCATQNVGGLVTGRANPIHVLCTAKAFDANNHELHNASIEPYAEAGNLSWYTDTDTQTQALIYTIDPGATPPLDVDPFDHSGAPRPVCPAGCITDPTTCDAEPCWVENGITHNPRDGVATLMVAVPGVPGFFDQNSNGEPFIDADDDGQREESEFFIDVNGNGTYDSAAASGGSDQDPRMLWKAFRVIWSGSADISQTGHGSSVKGSVAGQTLNNLTVRLNDKNYNKLAADSPEGVGGDTFQLAASCTADGTLTGNAFNGLGTALDPGNPGIVFNAANGDISGPGLPSTYRQETDTNLQQIDGPTSISGQSGPSTCTVTATVSRTYDPGAGTLFESNGTSSSESVAGIFSFAAAPDGGS